jgi:hypothetical protein
MSLLALETAAVGAPITRGGVSLFPVYVAGAAPDVRIRDGAAGVVIAEADDATVPTITVTNTNPDPVVLVEGETVRGGNQDRTLNVTILVPAGTVVACPVSCVERGRWGGIGEFGRSRTYAPRRVRRAKSASVARNVDARGVKQSDQSLVWRMVDHELARLSVSDPASALRAADAAIERDDRAAAAVRDLVGRGPLPGQRGVVVAHGRRVVAADVFADTDLLAAHWEALVRGYLLDRPERVEGRPSATAVLRFLRRFAGTPARSAPGVGLGTEYHARSDRLVGQALVWDDVLVHASAFALAA